MNYFNKEEIMSNGFWRDCLRLARSKGLSDAELALILKANVKSLESYGVSLHYLSKKKRGSFINMTEAELIEVIKNQPTISNIWFETDNNEQLDSLSAAP